MTDASEALEVVRRIAEDVRAEGGRALLVGGCVRDALLGRPRVDFDVEVFGLPGERLERLLRRRHRLIDVGRSYGVLKLDGFPVDVSLPRRETKISRGHRGFAVDADPNLDLVDAAARRDLTINALYEDPLGGEILDPLGGLADLRGRLLRHCSEHFPEDPLRVLRVMQFAARFSFDVAPETLRLCATLDLRELPSERVELEFQKLFRAAEPSLGLRFLVESRSHRHFAGLAMLEVPDFLRAGEVCDRLAPHGAELGEDRDAVFLAVLAAALGPQEREALLEQLCTRVRTRERALLLAERCAVRRPPDLEPPALRSFVRRLAKDTALRSLLLLRQAQSGPLPSERRSDPEWREAEDLRLLDRPLEALVLGRDLLAAGERPGPALGKLLAKLLEAQILGEFDDREGGLRCYRERLSRDP